MTTLNSRFNRAFHPCELRAGDATVRRSHAEGPAKIWVAVAGLPLSPQSKWSSEPVPNFQPARTYREYPLRALKETPKTSAAPSQRVARSCSLLKPLLDP